MSSMLNVVQQVVVVFTILVSCVSLELTCFPGCKNTESWSFCFPISIQDYGPHFQRGTCIQCPTQLQKQPVLKNSSQPTSTCLPNKDRVAIRGFSFGILSVQKLRPPVPQLSEINDLALVQCGITNLEQGILAKFPGLQSLYINFNNLTHIKKNWFDDVSPKTRFYSISLSHNHISNIDSKCFQNLTFLRTLLLDSNSLQSIHPSWFHNLKWLGHLSLKSNSIAIIPPQAFKSLSRLGRLDLSRNALTCLSRETLEGLHRLRKLSLGGNRLFALADSVHLVMNWRLEYRHLKHDGQHVAVRVNKSLFCITEIPQLRQFYHVQMQHDNRTQAARPSVEPLSQCTAIDSGLTGTGQRKYSLPLIIISVNKESDKNAKNITHLCKHAWEYVSLVKVALRGDITLQIVPMGIDRSCNPQIVAIVLSDTDSDRHSNNVSAFGHEEMMNVTCLVNTWEETYQHVFTTPLSSTPDGTVCAEKTQATRAVSSTPDDTVCPREVVIMTTREPEIKTTKLTLNQTNPSTNGTVKEKSPRVAIITMVVVVGVVLVALFVMYVVRRRSRGDQAAQAAGHLAGVHGTAPSRTTHQSSSSGDDPQYSVIPDEYYNQQNTGTTNDYSQIPDEYYNYYNTRPGAQHPYWEIPDEYYNYYNTRPGAQHPYWEIPDEYYNYYNTRPGAQHPYWEIPDEYHNRYSTYPPTRRVPQDNKDYSVRLNTTTAEVALPSSTRLGGKHPSYDTAPQVWRDPQNYQIPARGRDTNIRAQGMPVAGNSIGPRYMGLIDNRRRLSYPLTLRVPQDNKDYSSRINSTAAEVALPSSTRLGGKHPSYDTAPQVWRDPQNYQIPARCRQTNIRAQGMPVSGSSSDPRYMGLIGNYSKTMRAAKFRMQAMPLYNPLAHHSRHQRSTKYQASIKAEPTENKNHPNLS
ncbi:uncharacterized protein LOC118405703 [Branchiostoma floridae]|uniref:Uncharacterized protein LOC118405703 n=1 Tax=Branchiostoma floridae TaxID=7739 RepID=A0A9J7KJ82_BRAFL|nr:uncharacterized protein LOC118405703 [Branchiostoma floridae]